MEGPKVKASKSGKGSDKVAPAAKARVPLQPTTAHNIVNNGRKIEEVYQKKTQLEHILLRPDTYVGSIEKSEQKLWVYEDGKMVLKNVSYCPGLYKIFDEILVNAADNKQRDPTMDTLKVDIDPANNTISVYNNGDGIPVEMHSEEGVYVPELIFGHLLTSSNYNDDDKKTTGGRNGYGAKLTNIFSTEFTIETADGKRLRKYKQVFKNNMSSKSDPVIKDCKGSDNWTRVTFKPDLAKFHMAELEADVVALMSKRVVDMAGCLGKTVKVELNGQRLPIKSFLDYCSLYLSSAQEEGGVELPKIYEKVNDRWEVCVSLSDGQFQQVSFVNSIATIKGGTHVQHASDKIVDKLLAKICSKKEAAGTKAHQVRSHLWIFVNSLVENPAFDSQTKETLTTKPSSFGSKCDLSDAFMTKVMKCGVVESVQNFMKYKHDKELKKKDGTKRTRLTGIAKLADANDAGGRFSEDCTLILTEGDSAKALAISGLTVVGRDRYGVFPLRGKLLNVRDASHAQIMGNAEINNIKQIMGLQHGKVYDSTKSLRYGHLMIMTDQDHDGSHIKGLLINFLHAHFPTLLKVPNFLLEFITPIVKATNKSGSQTYSFYTIPEYENWKESVGPGVKSWTIKYYKGLGTSTDEEAQEYFAALEKHKKIFEWEDDQDGEAIELAFSKKQIEARKNWLRTFQAGTFLDQSGKMINYKDFVNKELILFSLADLARSIPSMMDGLKPGQRKILFTCFKVKQTKEIKVAALSGLVSAKSAYHHGEASLQSTIVGLAQCFVGSNNISILVPQGQFGTRSQGGKDAASARYIHTKLAKLTRFVFPEADDCLLDYLNDDGLWVEPQWYAPILPLVLVNGSEGIGTGWSSFVPNYNPRDIVANIQRLIRGEELQPMDPWYKGFKGLIERAADKANGHSYTVSGIINKINETTLEITELPIRKWTDDYKEFLESMMTTGEKGKEKEPFIKDYKEYHTDTSVHFEIYLSEENMRLAEEEGLHKKFKLTSTISTTNMHLFDSENRISKYETPEAILESFFGQRLGLYEKRKAAMQDQFQYELTKASYKVKFILMVVSGELEIRNRKKVDVVGDLRTHGFPPMENKWTQRLPTDQEEDNENDSDVEVEASAPKGKTVAGYEYLLSMPISSLTFEKMEELKREQQKRETDMEILMATSTTTMWERDLEAFLGALDEQEQIEADKDAKKARQRRNAGGGKRGNGKSKKNNDSDDDYEVAPKRKPAAKQAGPKAASGVGKTKATVPLSGAASSDSAELMNLTNLTLADEAPKKKAPAQKKAAAAPKPKVEETYIPLAQRLALKKEQAKAGAESPESGGSGGVSGGGSSYPSGTSREAPKRAAAVKAAAYVESLDDGDIEEDRANVEDKGKAVPSKATSGAKAKAAPRKKKVVSDSEEDFEESQDSDSESDFDIGKAKKMPAAKSSGKANQGPKATVAGRKRATAKAKPVIAGPSTQATQASTVVDGGMDVMETSPAGPDNKVRRIRPSPFNKKSGDAKGKGTKSSPILVAGGRPVRANRKAVKYVLSSDDSADEEIDEDDEEEEEEF